MMVLVRYAVRPGAVAEGLALQGLEGAVVLVEDERTGLVRDRVAGGDHVEERGEVVATLRSGAGAERGVEAPERAQRLGAERHVGPGAERAGGVREERIGARLRLGEHLEREALVEAGGLLHPALGRGLELEREDHPGDAPDAGLAARTRRRDAGASRVHHDVVVGERHDRRGDVRPAPRLWARARPGRSSRTYSEARVLRVQARDELGGLAPCGPVVDDDDLGRRVIEAADGLQAPQQALGPVPGGDHDGRPGAARAPGRRAWPRVEVHAWSRAGYGASRRARSISAAYASASRPSSPRATSTTPIGMPSRRARTTAAPVRRAVVRMDGREVRHAVGDVDRGHVGGDERRGSGLRDASHRSEPGTRAAA